MTDTPAPVPEDDRLAEFKQALRRMQEDPAEAAHIEAEQYKPLHYLPRGFYVKWTSPKGKEVVARTVGPVEHQPGYYFLRTVEDNTRCTRHIDTVTQAFNNGRGVDRLTSQHELRVTLEAISYPGDGHEPDEAEIRAEVRGFSLDNAGSWPLERNTHIGVEGPVAGCPRPVAHPAHTELYVRLFKGEQAVADVNIASLLAWAGYGAAAGPPQVEVNLAKFLTDPEVQKMLRDRAARDTTGDSDD